MKGSTPPFFIGFTTRSNTVVHKQMAGYAVDKDRLAGKCPIGIKKHIRSEAVRNRKAHSEDVEIAHSMDLQTFKRGGGGAFLALGVRLLGVWWGGWGGDIKGGGHRAEQ